MTERARQKLAEFGIQLAAETPSYFLFTRENLLVLVERRADAFGSMGSTGMLTAQGLAYLVWRGGEAFLKSKSTELPAGEADLAAIRQFSQDLESALR